MAIIVQDYGTVNGGASLVIEQVALAANDQKSYTTENCLFYGGMSTYTERPSLSGGVNAGTQIAGSNVAGATVTYSNGTLTIKAGSSSIKLTIMYEE